MPLLAGSWTSFVASFALLAHNAAISNVQGLRPSGRCVKVILVTCPPQRLSIGERISSILEYLGQLRQGEVEPNSSHKSY